MNISSSMVDDSWLHGRAWLIKSRKTWHSLAHIEWSLFKTRSFRSSIHLGSGDNNSDVCFHFSIPFLISFYVVLESLLKHPDSEIGFAIHNDSLWTYIFANRMEHNRDDKWHHKTHCWDFPWSSRHLMTEVLLPDRSPIWNDRGGSFMETYEARKKAEDLASETFDYTYVRKNGEIQKRKATCHITRMHWGVKWWPFMWPRPFKTRTDMDIRFDDEVGEGSGSWKGGVLGCGHEILPGETVEQCLRRFESTVKFNR